MQQVLKLHMVKDLALQFLSKLRYVEMRALAYACESRRAARWYVTLE
jgi:hypothetical protein